MMKWGRRKTFSASGPFTFMSRASLCSWLSKFKHMRINSEPNHGKMKQKAKQNSTTSVGSSPQYSCGNGGGFHVRDGDALWRAPQYSCRNGGGFLVRDGDALWRARPSFGDESHVDKKSEEDVDGSAIPSSSFPNGRSRRNAKKHGTREDTLKFKEKDVGLGLGEEIKLLDDRKVSLEMDEYNSEKEYEHLSRFERKAQRVLQEQEAAEKVEFASSKVEEKNVLQLESPGTICTPRTHSFASFADSSRSNFKVRSTVDCYEKAGRQAQKKSSSNQRQNLKQTEGLKVKTTNKKRQTLDVSREPQRRKPKHSPGFRIYSPRMASKVEVCRIKALEDMRKAKLKMMRKEIEEQVVEGTQGSDSFAVIKCSSDPNQDFRDSMIEMIMEKQIRHPEEMEELLACYLTLNADEYHDLIIKVFRQVWFDMSQDGSCCE